MQVKVTFSGTRLADYATRVAELGARGEVEMARGLNDAGDLVLTQVRKALQGQMNVLKYGTILDTTHGIPAAPGRSVSGHLTYAITASGKGLPIRDFPVQASVGGPVTAEPWGVAHTFKRSFVTKTGRLLARRTASRFPIRGLRGPSPAKELVKGQSLDTFERAVPALVEPTIMRRLVRLMP